MFYRQRLSRRDSRRAGFTTLEYAVLIAALTVSLLVAQTYLRRAVSSRWRDFGDNFGSGRQYKIEGSGQTVITR